MKYRLIILLSLFAFLCGCKAIVPEKPSRTEESWQPPRTQSQITTQPPARTVSPTHSPTQSPKSKEKPSPSPSEKSTQSTVTVSTSALSNVKYGFGMKRVLGKAPEVGGKYMSFLSKYNAYYIGDKNSKDLYLTFDEGYENGYTGKILDVLKANNVKACFFITKPYLDGSLDLVKRMVAEGHDIGNHTVNHPSMPEITDDKKLEEELLGLDRDFYEKTGKSMKFLRPPKGEFSERTLAISNQLGYKTIFWSFAYMDWDVNNQKGADYAYKTFMDYIHGGAIILLHAVSKDNAEGLDRMIKETAKQGYTYKSLNQLK